MTQHYFHLLKRHLLKRGLWFAVLLLPLSAMAVPLISAADLVNVSGSTLLSIDFPTQIKYKVFTLDRPNRIVIDLDGVEISRALKALPDRLSPQDPTINAIRIGKLTPKVTRIVLDIKADLPDLQTFNRAIGGQTQRLTLHWFAPEIKAEVVPQPPLAPHRLESKTVANIQQALEVLEEDRAKPPAQAAHTRFVLRNVTLAGNTLFTQPALAKFWKDKIGQEITLLDIYTIARSITEHYQAEGYVLAAAQVPQQKISAGLAKIEIEEGLVSEITVHDVGGKFLKTESARLKSALQNKPLQIKQLEQYLLQDHPGTIARAYFKPTEQKGSTALSVILTRTPPPSPRGVGL